MQKPTYSHQGREIEGYDALEELALDFIWSWNENHRAQQVWQQIDNKVWNLTHNPWLVLQAASKQKLESVLNNQEFRKIVDDLIQEGKARNSAPSWFQKEHASSPLTCAAYFSMEYMLGESLPIYSGGLGNVAGDQLKAASDLSIPLVGIGLLYQQGYFRQVIDKEGNQKAYYPFNSPEQLPIIPLRTPDGEWLRIKVDLPGWSMWLRTWQVKIGKVQLYLLDSNSVANYPPYRGIVSELYGGDLETRLQQELILGIGGWKLLMALGIKPQVLHLNEGHAAFALLERAHTFMQETKVPFDVALNVTRAGNLFTTHTAVSAGFDRFPPHLIEQYLTKYAQNELGISCQDLLALGRQNPHDQNEPFNMAYLAIRGSGAINGVSQLHGEVSRSLFQPLFPRWPQKEVPVGYVTNGVHMPTWSSIGASEVWNAFGGKHCWLSSVEETTNNFVKIPDAQLWQMRNLGRTSLIEYSRERLTHLLEARGETSELVNEVKYMFDPNILTLGFARRFATYKRPNLLLHDPERLVRILSNRNFPVQLILAGKAHPADLPGQALIREWINFIKRPDVRSHVMFLSDDDMLLTEHLVQGVDVWINTPRRPWEACGTSGMKVLVNGGLNLSELDGWWVEAYRPEVGWALGDGQEHGDDPEWDATEAARLYDLLENEIIPEYYNRDKDGIPRQWMARVRESMAYLTPQFCAHRTMREYTERYYLPAATTYQQRAANNASMGTQMLNWHHTIHDNWPKLHFGEVNVTTSADQHAFQISLYLGELDPNFVKVELFYTVDHQDLTINMKRERQLTGDGSTYIYTALAPATHSPSFYTPRTIPFFETAAIPLESHDILWQK
jgi:starch phosphorylase